MDLGQNGHHGQSAHVLVGVESWSEKENVTNPCKDMTMMGQYFWGL